MESPVLDAVGSLASVIPPDGVHPSRWHHECTGTLIAQRAVLTSRHCASAVRALLDGGTTVGFVLDANVAGASRGALIVDVELARVEDELFSEGSLGVLYLEQKVTGVAPLAVAPAEDARPGPYFSVGYGMAWNEGGVRHAGEVTLQASEGSWFAAMFGSFDAFYAWQTSGKTPPRCEAGAPHAGDDWSCRELASLRESYARRLEDEDFLLVAASPSLVRACTGDEGGPLLRADADGIKVYGVYTHSYEPHGNADSYVDRCSLGALYASMGSEALRLLAVAQAWVDPCEHAAQRYCGGDVLRQCIREAGRFRRLTRDCPSRGLTCMQRADGSVGCGDGS